jgi:hypothetical protein
MWLKSIGHQVPVIRLTAQSGGWQHQARGGGEPEQCLRVELLRVFGADLSGQLDGFQPEGDLKQAGEKVKDAFQKWSVHPEQRALIYAEMHPIRMGAQVRRQACAGLVLGKSLLVRQRERESQFISVLAP